MPGHTFASWRDWGWPAENDTSLPCRDKAGKVLKNYLAGIFLKNDPILHTGILETKIGKIFIQLGETLC